MSGLPIGSKLTDWFFVDDTTLVTDSSEKLITLLSEFENISEKKIIMINVGKNEVLRRGLNGEDQEEMQQVPLFN